MLARPPKRVGRLPTRAPTCRARPCPSGARPPDPFVPRSARRPVPRSVVRCSAVRCSVPGGPYCPYGSYGLYSSLYSGLYRGQYGGQCSGPYKRPFRGQRRVTYTRYFPAAFSDATWTVTPAFVSLKVSPGA